MSSGRTTLVLILTTTVAFQAASAQLTLREAINQADRAGYDNRIATAETAAQEARSIAPLKGILPSVHFEAGYIRTTDPIGVFGSTLRQRSVSQSNFDPQRLNHPDALGNHQAAVVVEQPIVNADAWLGRRSANLAASATRASEEWTRLTTRVDVVRAYYGVVLADERVATLKSAVRAAQAHVSQAQALVRQGVATKSDALLASVRAGELDAQLAEAEGAASNARRGLSVLLGEGPSSPRDAAISTLTLPSSDQIRAVVSGDTAETPPVPRADVRAALDGLDAARSNALRARSLALPRINSFARYDWNSADKLLGANRNWTVGIMASWSPFTNSADISEIRETAGRRDAALAQAEAAQAKASLELEQSRTSLQVALARLAIAEKAVAQSAEAHRLVTRKYEGGLAQVAELLDAQAVETQSALSFSQARWAAIVAAAERKRALGMDPATLEALDEQPSRSTSMRN